ncbi:MAG: TetR/AcrR family transcriptional regulator [Stenotrophobium sp.]
MKKKSSVRKKGRVYGGQDHDVRAAERREQFLQAGLEVFGTLGYRAATVRFICKSAGLTDRYYYEAFGDAETLLCAVYQKLMTDLRVQLTDAVSASPRSIEDAARAGLKVFFEHMRDPKIARITLLEVLGVSPSVDAVYNANTQSFANLLMLIATQFDSRLQLPPEQSLVTGVALAGAVTMTATHWMLDGYRLSLDAVVEGCYAVLIGTVRQFAKPQPPQARRTRKAG